MKLFVVFLIAIVAVTVSVAVENIKNFNIREPALRKEYAKFLRIRKNRFHSLRSNGEVNVRFNIFANNLKTINEHNNRNSASYKQATNKFSDKTPEERNLYKGLANVTEFLKKRSLSKRSIFDLREINAPADYDHRKHGHVTEVTNQGDCGSCWTYGVVYPLEGEISILSGKPAIRLSQQEILSCAYEKDEERNGCNGGIYTDGWDYVKETGHLSYAKDEPYLKIDMHCDPDILNKPNAMAGYQIKDYIEIPVGDDKSLMKVAYKHVVAVALESAGLFFYSKGVFTDKNCQKPAAVDHAVTLVGYNPEVWIVKNSWGPDWGEDGFVKMSRKFKSHCGISDLAYFPVVVKLGENENKDDEKKDEDEDEKNKSVV